MQTIISLTCAFSVEEGPIMNSTRPALRRGPEVYPYMVQVPVAEVFPRAAMYVLVGINRTIENLASSLLLG